MQEQVGVDAEDARQIFGPHRIRGGVVPEEGQPGTRPPLPERAGRAVQDERGEGEDDAAAPPAAPPRLEEVVKAEDGQEVDDPELHVEGEPAEERHRDPLPDRSRVEHDQGRERQADEPGEDHVVGAQGAQEDLERRRGDHERGGERREERVAPADEDRVADHAERSRHQDRGGEKGELGDAEELERRGVEQPDAEAQLELVGEDRAVGGRVHGDPELLAVVAQDEARTPTPGSRPAARRAGGAPTICPPRRGSARNRCGRRP